MYSLLRVSLYKMTAVYFFSLRYQITYIMEIMEEDIQIIQQLSGFVGHSVCTVHTCRIYKAGTYED